MMRHIFSTSCIVLARFLDPENENTRYTYGKSFLDIYFSNIGLGHRFGHYRAALLHRSAV